MSQALLSTVTVKWFVGSTETKYENKDTVGNDDRNQYH